MAMFVRLPFPQPIPEELVAELEKGAAYASRHLEALRVAADRRSVELTCAPGAGDEVVAKVGRYVDAVVATFRGLGEPEELGRREADDRGPRAPDAYAELVRRRWALPLGRGQVGLAGGAYALRRALDEDVRAAARAAFGAEDEEHPALFDGAALARSGYAGSFPQSICLASHMAEDFDAIEAFRAANTGSPAIRVPDPAALAHADAALRPAICLPVYQARAASRLPPEGVVVTTAGHAFRYESRNMEGLARLWDFSMREIVFVGAAGLVEARRAAAVALVGELAARWDLAYRFVSASDPFFATVRGSKALWQRARSLKHEVIVDLGGADLAVASVNAAGSVYGHAFDITTHEGDPATTACVGFGLERLVLALFTLHGFERARWPAALGEVIFG
jgi:seryl-tRNA synthetase